MSCVASVTMNGCRLNFAVQKPFTRPIIAPIAIMMRITQKTGTVPICGNILLAYPEDCKSDAATQAHAPTARPAERSVPVSIIAPAIPSAIGRFAAESEIIFTIDPVERNRGRDIAIPTITITRIIHLL